MNNGNGQIGILYVMCDLLFHWIKSARLHLIHIVPDAHVRNVSRIKHSHLVAGVILAEVAFDDGVHAFFAERSDALFAVRARRGCNFTTETVKARLVCRIDTI